MHAFAVPLALARDMPVVLLCDFDGGEHAFLKADSSIDCHSDRYTFMATYASLMLIIYSIGLPLARPHALAVAARAQPAGLRGRVARGQSAAEEQGVIADPITGFALHFKPRFWWFEVFTLGRRAVALTSAVLAFPSLESSTIFTLA